MILLTATAVRAVLVAYAERNPALFDFPDSRRYVLVARNIAAGLGPVESPRLQARTDPLYPYLLSIGASLGSNDDEALMRFGRILNALLSVAGVALLAVLARSLVGERAALIAAAILAVDPILLFFNVLVLTETAYAALLLAAVFALVRLGGSRRIEAWAWIAGVLLGLAALLRSSSVLMPVAMMPFAWHFAGGPTRRRLAAAGLMLVAAAVMLTPTIARNYRLSGRFVPVCTNGGASLLDGLGPWADGATGMDRIRYPSFPPDADEYERDRLCRQVALQWAWANPAKALSLAWVKLGRTWSITINAADYSSPLYQAIGWLTVAPVYALTLAGIWLLRRRAMVVALLLAPAIYFTLLHMVFVGSVRYRVAAMPMLFVLAGVAVDRFLAGRKRRLGPA